MQGLAQLLSSRLFWLAVASLAGLWAGTELLARLFWFEALGYEAVFRRILLLKVGLFVAAALVAYLYAFANLATLRRNIGRGRGPHDSAGAPWTPVDPPILPALRQHVRWLLPAAALASATVAGLVVAANWDTVLRFAFAQPFGRVDPVFGRDLGFYAASPGCSRSAFPIGWRSSPSSWRVTSRRRVSRTGPPSTGSAPAVVRSSARPISRRSLTCGVPWPRCARCPTRGSATPGRSTC